MTRFPYVRNQVEAFANDWFNAGSPREEDDVLDDLANFVLDEIAAERDVCALVAEKVTEIDLHAQWGKVIADEIRKG